MATRSNTVIARKSSWLMESVALSILGHYKLPPMICLQQCCSRPASLAVSAQSWWTVEDKTPEPLRGLHHPTRDAPIGPFTQPHSEPSNPSRAVFGTFGEILLHCSVQCPAAAAAAGCRRCNVKDAQVAPNGPLVTRALGILYWMHLWNCRTRAYCHLRVFTTFSLPFLILISTATGFTNTYLNIANFTLQSKIGRTITQPYIRSPSSPTGTAKDPW